MNGGAAACVAGRARGFHSLLLGWRPSAAAPRINPSSSLDRRPWAGLGWQHTFLTYQPNKVERLFYREGGREGGTLLTVVPTSFRLPYRTPSLPSPRNTAQHNRSHRPLFPSPRLFNSIRTARPPGHRSNRMRRICIPKLVILLLLCTRTLPAGVSSAKIHGKNIWIRAQSICQCSN